MPYKIFMTGSSAKRHCVYKTDGDGNRTGETLGCHPTHARAQSQMAAVHAAEGQRKEHDKGKAAEIAQVYETLGLATPAMLAGGQNA